VYSTMYYHHLSYDPMSIAKCLSFPSMRNPIVIIRTDSIYAKSARSGHLDVQEESLWV
jgi:hypothetical protein